MNVMEEFAGWAARATDADRWHVTRGLSRWRHEAMSAAGRRQLAADGLAAPPMNVELIDQLIAIVAATGHEIGPIPATWLTVKATSLVTGVPIRTIRRWASSGRVLHHRVGRTLLVDPEEVRKLRRGENP